MLTILYRCITCTLLVLIVVSPKKATCENYFMDCGEALVTREFKGLNMFYERQKDNPLVSQPSMCFKLNKNEYLVTVESTGRIRQGLYYVNVLGDDYVLDEGKYMPNIGIEKEFTGKNNKRYVLISWSNLHHGYWEYGYNILQLIPKHEKLSSYVVYNLIVVNEDPVDGLCGGEIKEGIAESIDGYNIIDEGTERVKIVVNIKEQNCKTLIINNSKKYYVLTGKYFKLSK